jgi:hypothetical protein
LQCSEAGSTILNQAVRHLERRDLHDILGGSTTRVTLTASSNPAEGESCNMWPSSVPGAMLYGQLT